MSNDVFFPEVIVESPFPTQDAVYVPTSNSDSAGTYSPTTTKVITTPKKRSAVELLSTALNTRSKNVLQQFDLVDSGGFRVGKFEEGISGDVRITPNGLTGRDQTGIVTFALDTNGNLVLKGEIRSGSFITGQVIVGNNAVVIDVDENGNGTIVVNDGTYDRVLIGYSANGF